MSNKRGTPKQFSAYLVEGSVLIEKGALLDRDWNVINFATGKMTGATGKRLARLCPDCRIQHRTVGALGHDGDCGSDDAKEEARQVIAHAKKRVQSDA